MDDLESRLEENTAIRLQNKEILMWHDPNVMRRIKDEFSMDIFLQKKNPLQEKYFKLTRMDDENVAREL